MSRKNCLTEKVDTVSFMRDLESELKKLDKFRRVSFFGSITNPDNFCAGRSDLDVIIFGDLSKEQKKEARSIMRELSEKYKIQEEKAVYLHPVPFFMKRDIEESVLKLMFNEVVSRLFTEKWRTGTKEKMSITLEQREKKHKKPARMTRISEILWR